MDQLSDPHRPASFTRDRVLPNLKDDVELVVRARLAVEVAQMESDGRYGKLERPGDGFVFQAAADEGDDLDLARRQVKAGGEAANRRLGAGRQPSDVIEPSEVALRARRFRQFKVIRVKRFIHPCHPAMTGFVCMP